MLIVLQNFTTCQILIVKISLPLLLKPHTHFQLSDASWWGDVNKTGKHASNGNLKPDYFFILIMFTRPEESSPVQKACMK